MIYQITGGKDLANIPWADPIHKETAKEYLSILDEEYGTDRNSSEGGYLLYATPGTSKQALARYFDYTAYQPEYTDIIYSTPRYQLLVYILATEYGVVVMKEEEHDC